MPSSDESLVTHGSATSFEEFFDAERARLFGALSVMTGNRHEAEEIMQDAFLRLWERWERVSAMDEPVGFLYRTAMNLYRKRLRRGAVAVRNCGPLDPRQGYRRRRGRNQARRASVSARVSLTSLPRSW